MAEEGEVILQEILIIEEPARKRPKLTEPIDSFIDNLVDSKDKLLTILSDDYYKPIPLTKVYVAQVKRVNDMSKIILLLNQRFPLKELSHLKRAFRKEVLLFPASFLTSQTHECYQKFMKEHLNEITDSFEYFKIVDVPTQNLKTRKHFMEYGKSWSCNFHMDKYLELLISGEIFSEKEIKYHRFHMGMAFEIARYYLSKNKEKIEVSDILSADINAAVVVDPFNKSVVAVAFDNRANNPIQHSTMLAIDNVAKTQNGGVWCETTDIDDVTLRGIGQTELLSHLKNKYPSVKFGAREYVSKKNFNEEEAVKNLSDAAKYLQNSPYLCTGYYIYLIREPCLMCAMGLVHARSKRVFYAENNDVGALGSKTKLQGVSSLNHHFEVFTGFL